jgi:hypothetical protein
MFIRDPHEIREAARLFFRLADLDYQYLTEAEATLLRHICFHGPISGPSLFADPPIARSMVDKIVGRLRDKQLIVAIKGGYQLTETGYRRLCMHFACLAAFEMAVGVAIRYLQEARREINDALWPT